uniref:Putative tRNA-dihydrouridine synthase n=1 Tax=Lygus hesperus TaxID=30085 RepID=A0A0A9WP78_LYGHE
MLLDGQEPTHILSSSDDEADFGNSCNRHTVGALHDEEDWVYETVEPVRDSRPLSPSSAQTLPRVLSLTSVPSLTTHGRPIMSTTTTTAVNADNANGNFLCRSPTLLTTPCHAGGDTLNSPTQSRAVQRQEERKAAILRELHDVR